MNPLMDIKVTPETVSLFLHDVFTVFNRLKILIELLTRRTGDKSGIKRRRKLTDHYTK